MAHRGLSRLNVPHVVYCRAAVDTSSNSRKSYLAFHDYVADEVCFHVYGSDQTAAVHALAGFLRVVTGFFAAQGLTSASISSDLRPDAPPQDSDAPPLKLIGNGPLASLRDRILQTPRSNDVKDKSVEQKDKKFFDDKKDTIRIRCFPAVGQDAEGLPTSGTLLSTTWDEGDRQPCASFFTMAPSGNLTCSDADASGTIPKWVVPQEPIDAYLKRVCTLDASVFVDEDVDPEMRQAPAQPPVNAPSVGHYSDSEKGG